MKSLEKKERGWGRNLKREKGIEWFGIWISKCDNGMVFEVGIPEKIEKKRDPWLWLVRFGLGVIMIEMWCRTDELKISEKLEISKYTANVYSLSADKLIIFSVGST